jgi:hypothetical protein
MTEVNEFEYHVGWHDAKHYSPDCPYCRLKELADDRNQKQVGFEQSLSKLITHYRILLLALEKCGIKIGKIEAVKNPRKPVIF